MEVSASFVFDWALGGRRRRGDGGSKIERTYAAIELKLSDKDVVDRWEAAKILGDRGLRADDADPQVFQTRIDEYHEKTLPVLKRYQELGLLISVPADLPRELVFQNVVNALANFASRTGRFVPEL